MVVGPIWGRPCGPCVNRVRMRLLLIATLSQLLLRDMASPSLEPPVAWAATVTYSTLPTCGSDVAVTFVPHYNCTTAPIVGCRLANGYLLPGPSHLEVLTSWSSGAELRFARLAQRAEFESLFRLFRLCRR